MSIEKGKRKTAIFWLTSEGRKTAYRISNAVGGKVIDKEELKKIGIKKYFGIYDSLIFIMATGIVVRLIAPYIQKKDKDPAVIVIDQNCRYVISLLSGHIGGANGLARDIAVRTGAEAVITTATDVQGVVAFDEFAVSNDLYIENMELVKNISSEMLNGKEVDLILSKSVKVRLEEEKAGLVKVVDRQEREWGVEITDRTKCVGQSGRTLILRPKTLVVGIGCKKGIDEDYLEEIFIKFLDEYGYSINSVYRIATIGLKKDEKAINSLCKKYNKELYIVSEEDIRNCEYKFEESKFVKSVTGVASVAESSAYLSSGMGEVLTGKVKYRGVTMALCRRKAEEYILQ